MTYTTEDTIEPENVIPFIPEGNFYFTKGVEAFRKRKYNIAIKWINKAIEALPGESLYKCQLSIIWTETGEYQKASELLQEVVDTSSDENNDSYYLLANNYAHLGLLQEAKTYAERYLEKEPDGEFHEEAIRLLEVIAMEVDEQWDDDWSEEDELLIYQEAVFQHMENSEWDQAIPLLEDMLTLFPEHSLAVHDYAQALFYSGEKGKAIQMEMDVLEQKPHDLYAHINLAVFYYAIQSYSAYEAHIQSILNVYPIYEEQKLRIGIALAKTENYMDAFVRFRTLSKGRMKGHLSYYKWYSIAAYQMGAYEKAHALEEEGCHIHPKLQQELKAWYVY